MVPNAKNLDCKIYPLSLEEQRQLDEFLDENLKTGQIRPSKSPMASPFFFVKKKDGTLRPIQDYRKLNDMTVKNRYPLPLIQELVDKLSQARYFTKLDVRWGFNNVRIKEGDEWKAAFRTNRGLFEPLVMFFGLTNSPATFQTMMNTIFKDEIDSGKVIIYLDDILIFTETLEEHELMVRKVLQKLRDNKLFLKHTKCEFERSEVEYLGLISHNTIRMDPTKVQAVVEWPTPRHKRDVQQFLGFMNFYRRFIEGFAALAKPLSALTGNGEWQWTATEAVAFKELKRRITSAPVLVIPKAKGRFRLEADSSDYALGAILSQQQEDGTWRPVVFISYALNETERNYEIYDKEMLAIMHALSECRQYLLGALEVFEIWTDHKNLEYFRKPQKLNRRQARWVAELQEFHFTLHHKPGKAMAKADYLSRRAGHLKGENDNENIVLLKPEHFRVHHHDINAVSDEIMARIKRAAKNRDKLVQHALANKEKDWTELDGHVVTWKHRFYVPRDKKLREDLIRWHHDTNLAGHPGRYKTHEMITRNYWWPRLNADIRSYVDGCQACQRTKPRRMAPPAPLSPNTIPTRPWQIVSCDLIGPLPVKWLRYDLGIC